MGYAPTRSMRRAAIALPALVAILTPVGASAQIGGVAPPAPPEAGDVSCAEKCLSLGKVAEGGVVEVSGKNLAGVATVRFADGSDAKARPQSDSSVLATVPENAKSGKVALIDDAGSRSLSQNEIEITGAAAVQDASGFRLREATAATDVAFFLGTRPAQLNYLFEAQGPTDVRVDVVRAGSDETVASIVQEAQEPFATNTALWNGRRADGRIARAGEYRFKVSALSGGGQSGGAGFVFADHRFPLAGRHDYGDGLGAGRDHMGQDIFAKCGNADLRRSGRRDPGQRLPRLGRLLPRRRRQEDRRGLRLHAPRARRARPQKGRASRPAS